MHRNPTLCQTKALSPDIKWKAFLPDTEQTHESEVAVVHGNVLNLDNHTIKDNNTKLLALDRIHRIVLEDDLTTKSSYDMTQYPGNMALISLFHSGKPLPSIVHLLMDKRKRSDFAVWLIMMLQRIDKHTADWEQTIGQLQSLSDSRMPIDFSDLHSSQTCPQRRGSSEYCSPKSIARESDRIQTAESENVTETPSTSPQTIDDCCNDTEQSYVSDRDILRYRSPSLNTKDIATKLIQSTWRDSCEREMNVSTPNKCARLSLSDDGLINTNTFQVILKLREIQEVYVGKRSHTLQAIKPQQSNGKYFSIIALIGSRQKIFDFEVCDKSVRRRVIQQISRKLVEMDLMDPKHRRKVHRSILSLDKEGSFSFHIRPVSDEQQKTNTESISEQYCTSDSLKQKENEFEWECDCDAEKNRDKRINPWDEVTKFDDDKDVIIAAKEVALEDMKQMVQRLSADNERLERNVEEEQHKSKANDREHRDVTRDLKISDKVMQKRVSDVLKQNESLRKCSEEIKAEKQCLKRELDSKERDMQQIQRDLDNLTKKRGMEVQRLRDASKHNECLRKDLKESVTKQQRMRRELASKGRDMQHLQNEFDGLYISHEAKLNRLSEVTKQNECFRISSLEIAARQQDWKRKLESMKMDMQMMQRDFDSDLKERTAEQMTLRRQLESKERDRQLLHCENADLTKKLGSQLQRVKEVSKQNESLREDLRESAAEQQQLRRELGSKERDLNHLQCELENYKKIEQTYVAELERIKSLFDKQKQETRALSVHINAQNGEIGNLRQNNEKLMAEVKSLQCSMIHNESLEDELRQSKLKWSRVIDEKDGEIDKLERELCRSHDEYQRLKESQKREIKVIQCEQERLQRELDRKERDWKSLECDFKQERQRSIEQNQPRCQEMESEVNGAMLENEDLKSEICGFQQQIKQRNQEIQRLVQTLKRKEIEIKAIRDKEENVRQEMERKERESTIIEGRYSVNVQQAECRIEECEQLLKQIATRCGQMEQSMDGSHGTSSENQGMENEIRTLQQEIRSKNQEIDGLNMKLQGLEDTKETQENINAVREAQQAELQCQQRHNEELHALLESKVADMEAFHDEMQKIQQSIEQKEREIKMMESNFKQDLGSKERDMLQLQCEFEAAKIAKNVEVEKLQCDNAELLSRIDSLQCDVDRMESMNERLRDSELKLKRVIDGKDGEIGDLNQHMDTLKESLCRFTRLYEQQRTLRNGVDVEMEALRSNGEQLRIELARKEKEWKILECQLRQERQHDMEQKQIELKEIARRCEEMDKAVEGASSDNDGLRKEKIVLVAQVNSLETNVKKMELLIKTLEDSKFESKREIDRKDGEMKEMRESLCKLKEDLCRVYKELRNLKKSVEIEMEAIQEDEEQLLQELDREQDARQRKENQMKQKRQQDMEQKENELRVLATRCQQMEETVARLENEDLKCEICELQQELDSKKQELEALRCKLQCSENVGATMEAKVSELERQRKIKEQEVEKLMKRLNTANQEWAELKYKEEEWTRMEGQFREERRSNMEHNENVLKEITRRCQEMENTIDGVKLENTNLQSENQRLQLELNRMKQEIECSKTKLQGMDMAKTAVEEEFAKSFCEMNQELQRDKAQLVACAESFRSENAQKLSELKQEAERRDRVIGEKDGEISKLTEQRDILKGDLCRLYKEHQTLMEMKQVEIKVIHDNEWKLKKRVEKSDKELRGIARRYVEIKNENKALKKLIACIEAKAAKLATTDKKDKDCQKVRRQTKEIQPCRQQDIVHLARRTQKLRKMLLSMRSEQMELMQENQKLQLELLPRDRQNEILRMKVQKLEKGNAAREAQFAELQLKRQQNQKFQRMMEYEIESLVETTGNHPLSRQDRPCDASTADGCNPRHAKSSLDDCGCDTAATGRLVISPSKSHSYRCPGHGRASHSENKDILKRAQRILDKRERDGWPFHYVTNHENANFVE